MHQNLLNAEFASVEHRNARDKNLHVLGVMKALTKVLHKSFCCTYACRQLDFLGVEVFGSPFCLFKAMGATLMGSCPSMPCFVNSRLICPRYASQSDNISCYSDGRGRYFYTGPVYGNFFWSTNGGTN